MLHKTIEKYGLAGTVQIIIYFLFTILYLVTLIVGGIQYYHYSLTPNDQKLPSAVGYNFTVFVLSILYGIICNIIGLVTKFVKRRMNPQQTVHLQKLETLIVIQGHLFIFLSVLYAFFH